MIRNDRHHPFFALVVTGMLMVNLSLGQSNNQDVISMVERGFHSIYHFEFTAADSTRKELHRQFPDHPWTYLYAVNYYWWCIIGQKERDALIKGFYSSLDSAKAKLDIMTASMDQTKLPFDYLYAYMYVYAFRSRIELMDHKFISALAHTNTCINFVEQSFDNESRYDPFNLTSGLYYFGTGFTRKKYPWLIPALMLVPQGDTETGKRYLVAASRSASTIINTEGTYFLMKIFSEFEPNLPVAEIYASILCMKYPKNLLYRYYYIRILQGNRKNKEAGEQIRLFLNYAESNAMLLPGQKDFFLELLEKLNQPY